MFTQSSIHQIFMTDSIEQQKLEKTTKKIDVMSRKRVVSFFVLKDHSYSFCKLCVSEIVLVFNLPHNTFLLLH